MGKKWLAAILISGIIIIVGVFIYFRKPAEQGIPAINAVSADAALVIKVNGLLPLLASFDENNWWQSIPSQNLKSQLNSLRQSFDSLCQESSVVRDVLNDSSVFFTLNGGVNEPVSVLMALPFDASINADKIRELVKGFCSSLHQCCYEYFEGKNVLQTNKNSSVCWYFYVEKGILVFSNSLKETDKSFHQIRRNISLLADTSFTKVYGTSGKNVAASIFINNSKFISQIYRFLKPEIGKSIRNTIETPGWTAVDFAIEASFLSVHGFTVRGVEKALFMKMLRPEQPAESAFLEVVSNTAAGFLSFAFSDPFNYKLALSAYIKENPHEKEKINLLRSKCGFEVDAKIAEILGEAVILVVEPNAENQYNKFCVIKTQESINAIDFVNLCKKGFKAPKQSRSEKQGINIKTDSIPIRTIYSPLAVSYIPAVLFGSAFEANYNCVANYNNYLILGYDEKTVSNYIVKLKSNKTLQHDSLFVKSTSEQLAVKSNISVVLNISKIRTLLISWFTDDAATCITKNFVTKSSGSILGLQLSGNGEYIYNSGFLYSNSTKLQSNDLEFTFTPDTGLCFAPQFILPGKSKTGFIVFQDSAFSLYKLSSSGKLLWKKKIDDMILGQIYCIDYFKNGKTQLLFNTSEKLYLFDMNGNAVRGFPVNFKQKATNGLVLADFDANLNYRYYLAFKNNSIMALTKEGRKVEGWKFGKTSGKICKPGKCFSFQGKDYIAFSDSCSIYLLNRKGEQKLSLKGNMRFCTQNELFIDNRPKYFRIVSSNIEGNVVSIYPDGHADTFKPAKLSANHKFWLTDVDSDGLNDYTLASDSLLMVFSASKKLIVSSTFPAYLKSVLINKKNQSTEFYVSANESVFKMNENGQILKGFPIKCNYSINFLSLYSNLNSKILLVTDEKGISAYSEY